MNTENDILPAKKDQTYEKAMNAVSINGISIKDVSKKYISKEMCRLAVTTTPEAIRVVPDEFLDKSLYDVAIDAAIVLGPALGDWHYFICCLPEEVRRNMAEKQKMSVCFNIGSVAPFYEDMQKLTEGAYSPLAWNLAKAAMYSYNKVDSSAVPADILGQAVSIAIAHLFEHDDAKLYPMMNYNFEYCKEGEVISLMTLYAQNRMFYWCNACGDVNIPGDPEGKLVLHTEQEMPQRIRSLYTQFWNEGSGATNYVVTIDGINGMAASFLMDKGFMEDICFEYHIQHETLDEENALWEKFSGCVATCAAALARKAAEAAPETVLSKARILYGHDTDPDGDEIILFVRDAVLFCAENKDCFEAVIEDIDSHIYKDVEELFLKALKANS